MSGNKMDINSIKAKYPKVAERSRKPRGLAQQHRVMSASDILSSLDSASFPTSLSRSPSTQSLQLRLSENRAKLTKLKANSPFKKRLSTSATSRATNIDCSESEDDTNPTPENPSLSHQSKDTISESQRKLDELKVRVAQRCRELKQKRCQVIKQITELDSYDRNEINGHDRSGETRSFSKSNNMELVRNNRTAGADSDCDSGIGMSNKRPPRATISTVKSMLPPRPSTPRRNRAEVLSILKRSLKSDEDNLSTSSRKSVRFSSSEILTPKTDSQYELESLAARSRVEPLVSETSIDQCPTDSDSDSGEDEAAEQLAGIDHRLLTLMSAIANSPASQPKPTNHSAAKPQSTNHKEANSKSTNHITDNKLISDVNQDVTESTNEMTQKSTNENATTQSLKSKPPLPASRGKLTSPSHKSQKQKNSNSTRKNNSKQEVDSGCHIDNNSNHQDIPDYQKRYHMKTVVYGDKESIQPSEQETTDQSPTSDGKVFPLSTKPPAPRRSSSLDNINNSSSPLTDLANQSIYSSQPTHSSTALWDSNASLNSTADTELSSSRSSLSGKLGRVDSFREAAKKKFRSLRRAFSLEKLNSNNDSFSNSTPQSETDNSENINSTEAKSPVMPQMKKPLSWKSLQPNLKRSSSKLSKKSSNASEIGAPTKPLRSPSTSKPLSLKPSKTPSSPKSPKSPNARPAVGKLLKKRSDGTKTVKILKPEKGRYGFHFGLIPGQTGVYITRFARNLHDTTFYGLISVGDKINKINGVAVTEKNINQMQNLVMKHDDHVILKVTPHEILYPAEDWL